MSTKTQQPKPEPEKVIHIDLRPENFPKTDAALNALLETISQEAPEYISAQKLPDVALPSLIAGLVKSMGLTLTSYAEELRGKYIDNVQEYHVQRQADGSIVPLDTEGAPKPQLH